MKAIKIMELGLCVFVGTLFAACSDDDEIEPKDSNEYALSFTLSCSEDILSYSSPVVSYRDASGAEKTITLTRNDFKDGKCERNLKTVESEIGFESIAETMSVTFEPTEEAKGVDKIAIKYDFDLSAKIVMKKNGKNKTEHEASTNVKGITQIATTSRQWKSAAEYLLNLSAKVTLDVDGDGKFSWECQKQEGESGSSITGGDGKSLSITQVTVSVVTL